MKIAIVGDYRPHNATHRALTDGLTMAGAEVEWVPSNEVDSRAERLAGYGGVVAAPGSPYAGMEGSKASGDVPVNTSFAWHANTTGRSCGSSLTIPPSAS